MQIGQVNNFLLKIILNNRNYRRNQKKANNHSLFIILSVLPKDKFAFSKVQFKKWQLDKSVLKKEQLEKLQCSNTLDWHELSLKLT